jgi:hypothetical protein
MQIRSGREKKRAWYLFDKALEAQALSGDFGQA